MTRINIKINVYIYTYIIRYIKYNFTKNYSSSNFGCIILVLVERNKTNYNQFCVLPAIDLHVCGHHCCELLVAILLSET